MHAHASRSSLHVTLTDLSAPGSVSSSSMRACAHLHRNARRFTMQSVRLCLHTQSKRDKTQHTTAAASFSSRNADNDLAGGGSSIPQPLASNAGSASTTTSSASPPSPHSNGSTPPSQENSTQTNTNELSQLRNEVSKLSELVTNQARMLQGQMKDLEDARSLIDMHAMTNTLSMAAPTQTIRAGWNKDVQPFEVQRNAIGDRRYLGGYDARYHSTNM